MTSAVTAFLHDRIIAEGTREAVTRSIEDRYATDPNDILVIDDESGRVVDLDLWDALASRQPRASGRPKLGVQAREVTLLPRHWEWLASQRGGASAALRRLVDDAQRAATRDAAARKDAGYRFLQATSGNRPGYEEALRALYAGDGTRLDAIISAWPEDLRRYLHKLLS